MIIIKANFKRGDIKNTPKDMILFVGKNIIFLKESSFLFDSITKIWMTISGCATEYIISVNF
jgi:hypothetical protein